MDLYSMLNSETRKPTIIRRPIQHLIPLEIRSKFGNEDEEELVDVNEESSGTQDLSTEPLDSDVKTAVVEKNRPKERQLFKENLYENYQNKRKNIRKMSISSYLV